MFTRCSHLVQTEDHRNHDVMFLRNIQLHFIKVKQWTWGEHNLNHTNRCSFKMIFFLKLSFLWWMIQWQLLQLSGSKIICECWFSRAIVTSIYQKKAPHSLYLYSTQIELDIKKNSFISTKYEQLIRTRLPWRKASQWFTHPHMINIKFVCHLANLADCSHQPHAVRPFPAVWPTFSLSGEFSSAGAFNSTSSVNVV